ncbi:MAG: hypothetical protein Q4F57_03605 [Weeksellaceae bacterium]|nr:hypothetical protein [Weeksellaceae bacterium]
MTEEALFLKRFLKMKARERVVSGTQMHEISKKCSKNSLQDLVDIDKIVHLPTDCRRNREINFN